MAYCAIVMIRLGAGVKEEELRVYVRANYPREDEACEWKAYTNLRNAWSSHEGEDVESYISAIANMNGGHLVIGVEDKTLNIVGIKKFGDYTATNVRLRLTGKVTNLDTENLQIEEITTSDTKKTIWIIHVPKHFPRLPVYAHRKVWQRLDDSLVEMRQERLNAILSESWGGVDWSADLVSGASLADLDESAIHKAREKFKGKHSTASWDNEIDGWDTTTFLDRVGLTAQGKITRAAILLVGRENSAHFLSPHPVSLTWKLDGTEFYQHFGPPFILSTTALLGKIRNVAQAVS